MVVAGAFVLALLFAPPEDYLAEGLKAMDANQPAAAEPLFRKAVDSDGADYAAHFNLALSLSLQRKDAEAIPELRKTLELKPGLYEADLNLGILLLRNGQPAEAVTVLKEAVTSKPREVRPQVYYAQALLETGDAAQAETCFASALKADPKSVAAQLGLARSLLKQAKLSEAAESFRAASALPGAQQPAKDGLLAIAAEYEKAHHNAEAIAIYQAFPEDAAVRQRLGQLQIDNQDAAAAIPNLEDAVRKAPTTANRLALADAYRISKQPAKVLEQLQLATAAEPGNFELRMALGRTLRDEHRMIPAAQEFLAAAKLQPDNVHAWNELASALIIAGNYAEGLTALDRIRALGKELPGDLYLRGITLDKLKQREQALAAYRQFLAASNGAFPDQEFLARQRTRIIESELRKK